MYSTKKKAGVQGLSHVFAVILSIILSTIFLSCGTGTDTPGKSAVSNSCDILIVGGGTGGFAAALQACEMASDYGIKKIIMTEETTWLGGQYTSQGVTASDDNSMVEQGRYTVGASKSFFRFHEEIRDIYRAIALETAKAAKRNGGPGTKAYDKEVEWINGTEFSPGNAWGSRMSFLPKDGVTAIDNMLKPYIGSGLLDIRYQTVPVAVHKDGTTVTGAGFKSLESSETYDISAKITIDATELGDLFPLAGIDYSIGIEASADTKEPSLFNEDGSPRYLEPMTDCQQSFTYTFAVEWGKEGEDNRLPWNQRPASYEENRHRFTMVDNNRWFLMQRWNDYAQSVVFAENRKNDENKPLPWIPPFWTYRRMLDARILDPEQSSGHSKRFVIGKWIDVSDPNRYPGYSAPNWQHSPPAVGDVIEVNWISNDYNAKPIIDVPDSERETALQEAKELSLGFLFWLWYEAPRDPEDPSLDPSDEKNWSTDPATGKNTGWSNLIYRPDVMGTEDGLSMYPYIREARRQKALFTVRQQHLLRPRSKRAMLFHDTVGIGHYFLDIHRCDVGCERKRDIEFKHVQLSDGSFGGENSSGRFQIPFGSLVPRQVDGFMAAAKNIGLTRIAASTYRLHPVEFEIGKAAAAAACIAIADGVQPRDIWTSRPGENPDKAEKRLRHLQHVLLSHDTPLYWNEDCGWDDEHFEAIQWSCLLNIIAPHGKIFDPKKPIIRKEVIIAMAHLSGKTPSQSLCSVRFTDLGKGDEELREAIALIEETGALDHIEGNHLIPVKLISGEELAVMIEKVSGITVTPIDTRELTRAEAAEMIYDAVKKRFELTEI